MNNRIEEAVQYLQNKHFDEPKIGIVLGTGLGKLMGDVEVLQEIDYANIPHFPTSTVESHKGKLIYGVFANRKVVIMQGRFHFYEGYSMQEITFPIRVMEKLGIKTLMLSNAAGAINLDFKKGELMLIDDHINLQGTSPLVFKGNAILGNIFVDLSEPYSRQLNEKLESIAKKNRITLHQGVYASVVGPQLETKAEYRMLKVLGADAVGMSTVPEVIVANQLKMKTLAVSVLTDECDPDNLQAIDIAEIIQIANLAEPNLVQLFRELVESLSE